MNPRKNDGSVPGRVGRVGRLRWTDLLSVGGAGLRSRPLRVVLSALGIAIGIAAMVAVVGISSSSRADLDARLDRLGTNLLTLEAGSTVLGNDARLPTTAVSMIERIPAVRQVSAVGYVPEARVYRSDVIPSEESGGISVLAGRLDLPRTVGAEVATGEFLNAATARYPTVVLGATTAEQLGVTEPGQRIWLAGRWFVVLGTLAPVELAPELDTAAVVGWPAAKEYLDFDGHPTTVYERSDPDAVAEVRELLAPTANPEHPEEVSVSRPSDALAAKAEVDATFTGLLLGLGAVALLVGGIGVANTMVISVLERRPEIGLRRALGAARRHIRRQFIAEALLLSLLGGLAGLVLGILVTFGYASGQGWPTVVPAWASVGGLCATLVIGGIAGLLPAIRAARLDPSVALATT